MPIERASPGWTTTRGTLRAYTQALTAFPRALAEPDPRWAHVSMEPIAGGFRAAPVALGDGNDLVSIMDLTGHRIVITAGSDSIEFDLTEGPSPHGVGTAVTDLIGDRRTLTDVETSRFASEDRQTYESEQAEAFLASAQEAVSMLNELNDSLSGELSGPHLWSHGFDIATEWYGKRSHPADGDGGEVTVMTGWFPDEEPYLYVNPWPFTSHHAATELPHGARWHTEGWHGAELAVPRDGLDRRTLIDVALAVHTATDEVSGTGHLVTLPGG